MVKTWCFLFRIKVTWNIKMNANRHLYCTECTKVPLSCANIFYLRTTLFGEGSLMRVHYQKCAYVPYCFKWNPIQNGVYILEEVSFYITHVLLISTYMQNLQWISLETYIFILNFSLPVRSEQLNGTHANEIKHDNSSLVIVVLDPRYD